MKPYITVIAANTVGKFSTSLLQVPHGNLITERGFISMSIEGINSRLMQMLWLRCKFFMFEALRQKFDCNLELIKEKFTQRCLMTNLDMESFF